MELTSKEIVEQLDKYIIGQVEAKKAVAIALRNRYRRSKLPREISDEITPKNIILKGATGVGKTEIARRLAKLVKSPFVKVEATKFTEVGYVGRDCESMIRDLVEVSYRMVKEERQQKLMTQASENVTKELVEILYKMFGDKTNNKKDEQDKIAKNLLEGKYEDTEIVVEVSKTNKPIGGVMALGGEDINIGSIFGDIMGKPKVKKKLFVKDARKIMIEDECEAMIDQDSVSIEAIKRAEEEGIIFIDEIDKIAVKSGGKGPDVSREGVQRDILPFVEGCSVTTKYGTIKTDYILFIAAGAFHIADVQNLIPELQGRFPIRVELNNLTQDDFFRILKEPKNAIILQYKELLKVDNIDLTFTDDALKEISLLAERENETGENIGARRLHALIEKLLEDISFNATGNHPMTEVKIDKEYVDRIFSKQLNSMDLNKYIL